VPTVLEVRPYQTIYRVYQRADGTRLLCIIDISAMALSSSGSYEVNILIEIGDQHYSERNVAATEFMWTRIESDIATHIAGADLIYDRRFHSASLATKGVALEQVIRLMSR
jgi:hypothetical protein